MPGIGPIIASAIVASVPDASVFRSGREFAAWLGHDFGTIGLMGAGSAPS
jgi:transposase